MREQEVRELYEAYRQVHQPQEEVEQLDENVQDAVKGALEKGANFMKTNPVGKAVSKIIAPVGGGRKTPTATSGGSATATGSDATAPSGGSAITVSRLCASNFRVAA